MLVRILQTEKFSELDEKNKVQEDKFLNFIQGTSFLHCRICAFGLVLCRERRLFCCLISSIAVAEEYRQHVESENEWLHSQLNELRSELASLRYAISEFQWNFYVKFNVF